MKRLLAIPFSIFLAFASCSQSAIIIPKEFVETKPPKAGSDKWYQLNHAQNFGVSIVNGKLNIDKVKEVSRCELKIKGGSLIGIDKGEWGGQLIFKPSDPTEKAIDIKGGNIKFIFHFNDKVYFIEGLAHMGYNGGAIFELKNTNNNFTFAKLVDFDDAPQAFTIYNDILMIATYENFYIVKNFKKQLVFKETFWNSLYPNSIAAFDDKNVFVGIRGGIVKLDLTDKTLKFYKKAN